MVINHKPIYTWGTTVPGVPPFAHLLGAFALCKIHKFFDLGLRTRGDNIRYIQVYILEGPCNDCTWIDIYQLVMDIDMIYLIYPRVISWCAMGNGAFIADFPVNKKVNVHNYDKLPYRVGDPICIHSHFRSI